MLTHLRLAFRTLSKSPGFTAIAVLTLALGIGMSTSSFSLTNSFLLRPLPYPESGDLIRVFHVSQGSPTADHSPGNMLDIREALTSCSDIFAYYFDNVSYGEPGQPPEQISGIAATANFLPALHLHPMLGRDFAPDDDQPGKPKVAILTARMWKKRYASDPNVLGRTLRLNNEDYTIIGVMDTSFHAPLVWGTPDFIHPLTIWPKYPSERKDSWISLGGRLKPGESFASAQAQLNTLAARFSKDYPSEFGKDGLKIVTLHDSNMDNASRALLWMITGLALVVLLVACANLAALQLARSFSRSREFAIRSALGASRLQLMVPLLAESMLLALGGGLLGILIASWSNAWLDSKLRSGPDEHGFNISMNPSVILFALLISLLTGLAFGLIPAWLASRTPAANALKESSRGSTGGRSHNRLRFALVVAEISLSLILVATAFSYTLATKNLLNRDFGWKADQITTGSIALPWNRYSEDKPRLEFNRNLLAHIQAIPGVEKSTLCNTIPVFSYFNTSALIIEGLPEPVRGQETIAEFDAVTADYFDLLKIPLRKGALFSDSIKNDDPAVAIINDTFAQHFWPNQDPIGKRFKAQGTDKWLEIIAVVGDVRMAGNLAAPATRLQYYRPLSQSPGNYLQIAVRSTLPAETVVVSLRKVLAEVDPDIPISNAGDLLTLIRGYMENLNLVAINLAAFAFMGLLIASIGIYGVISHITAQRTRDIGIRIALGATPADIQRQVLLDGLRLLLVGLLLGALGAYGVNKLMSMGMPEFGLPGLLPQTLSILALSLVTFVATYIPARRAATLDPVIALRAD